MPFRPNINDTLTIDGIHYRIDAHPAAPGMPYGQTGRRATVYQVIAPDNNRYALKVFTTAFRSPGVVEGAARLHPFTRLPGLQACARTALTAPQHQALLQQHPDLACAVLMPWVSGETWQEILLAEEPLTPDQSHSLAQAFVRILATLEQQGVAHCDLSGPNVLITHNPLTVALVDLEDLYGPGLVQPDKLPGGSPGYAHKTAPTGLWSADADRFAGAILLTEMLGWCDARVCQAAFGETYFDPDEMQQECERQRLLLEVLHTRWGEDVAALFDRVWHAETLDACPALMEWSPTLGVTIAPPSPSPGELVSNVSSNHPVATEAEDSSSTDQISYHISDRDAANQDVQDMDEAYRHLPQIAAISYTRALLRRGMLEEESGDLSAALADYYNARSVAPPALQAEVATKIAFLESQHKTVSSSCNKVESILTVEAHMVNTEPDGECRRQQLLADPASASPQKNPMWPLIGIAFFMLVLGVIGMWLGLLAAPASGESYSVESLSTATASSTRTPTPTILSATRTPIPEAAIPVETDFLDSLKQQGTLIASDTFDDNRSNWFVGESSDGRASREIRDGVLVMRLYESQVFWWENWAGLQQNYIAQIDVTPLTEGSEGGIIFGYQDGSNYYIARISADGDYKIEKEQNDEWETFEEWTIHASIQPGSATNQVTVVRQGNIIRLYVNNVLMTEIEDDTFLTGAVGVVAGSGRSTDAEILLDNFQIWRLP